MVQSTSIRVHPCPSVVQIPVDLHTMHAHCITPVDLLCDLCELPVPPPVDLPLSLQEPYFTNRMHKGYS